MFLQLNTIRDTTLWKKLKNGFAGPEGIDAEKLANNIEQICEDAVQRIKGFRPLHTQYTLHDEVHSLNVTEIMTYLVSEDVINELNPAEISLLILAAFFHDQGMVLDEEKMKELKNDDNFKLFKENWILNHPNFSDIKQRINDSNFSEDARERWVQLYNELQSALLTDYIRINHGKESKKYICSNFSQDKMWEISHVNISSLVGNLCKSHNEDIQEINEKNGFYIESK